MEKLFKKRMRVILLMMMSVMMVVVSLFVYKEERKVEIRDIEEMLEQVKLSYQYSQTTVEEARTQFKRDYLNRAFAIDFVLAHTSWQDIPAEMEKLKTLMEVESIHVFDAEGNAVYSTQGDFTGVSLKEHDQTKNFWPLLNTKNPNAFVIDTDSESIMTNQKRVYIGIKSSLPQYSMVQIGIEHSVLESFLQMSSIEHIVENTPTLATKAIFVVDVKTGDLLSITRNNNQHLQLENADTPEKITSALRSLEDGGLIRINDSWKVAKTKVVDDKIIGAYIDAPLMFAKMIWDVLYLMIGAGLVMGAAVMIFRADIRKYVLEDINMIQKNVKKIISGDMDVTFRTEHQTEFRELMDLMNAWNDNYKNKSSRLSLLSTAINKNLAVFECLGMIQKCFYADNMQEVLGIDDEEWQIVSRTPESFYTYIHTMVQWDKEYGYIRTKNRYLEIYYFTENKDFFGMVINRTSDVVEQLRTKAELRDATERAETDFLTGLKNRSGYEQDVIDHLQKSQSGTMILMDMDNFKQVNDYAGHPEGDRVLKRVADCLERSFRGSDILARLGGDEFSVFIKEVLPKSVLEAKMERLMEELRRELEPYQKYGLSVSAGVVVQPLIRSYERIYQCTDKILYRAKEKGKDCYLLHYCPGVCIEKNRREGMA